MNKTWAQIVSGILYSIQDPATAHLHIISSLLFKVMFCHVSGGGGGGGGGGGISKSPQRLQHIAMLPICLHQFAKKTPVVVSASSWSCQRSPAVVTELLALCHMYIYVWPLGRQKVVNKSSIKSFGDVLAIFDEVAVVKTAPVHRQTSPVGVKGALDTTDRKTATNTSRFTACVLVVLKSC